MASDQSRPALDAAHALERAGVVAGQGRVQEGPRAQEPDPARRVVQLIVTDRLGRLLLVTLEVARGRPRRADRYRPACELRRGRLRRASLYIPELETHNVKRNGPPGAPATRQSDLFHRLILRNERVAGVAAFPVAWITPRACDALTRQTTVLELLPDEAAGVSRTKGRKQRDWGATGREMGR